MYDEAVSITDLAGHLRRIAPSDARLARALFDGRTRSLAAAAGVRLRHAARPQPREPFRINLRAAEGELDVIVDMRPHPVLAVVASAEDDALREALGGLMLAPQLDRLATVLGQAIELAGCAPGMAHKAPAEIARQAGVAIALGGDEQALTAILQPADDSFAALLEARIEGAPLRLPRTLRGLALPTRVRLGGRLCAAGLLESLRPGDVLLDVLPAGTTADTIAGVALDWGAARGRRLQTQGRIDGRRITIEEIVTMSVDTLDFPAIPSGEDGRARPIPGMEALEIPVHLELDTIALPLGRVAALLPGQVLELPVAAADTRIRLVAYGQTLGVGQLVAVGDNLGVQIDRIFEPDPARPPAAAAETDDGNAHARGAAAVTGAEADLSHDPDPGQPWDRPLDDEPQDA